MRTKINPRLEKLVLNARKGNPHLGVRGLAHFLKERYKVSLSKSTIHALLRQKAHPSAGREQIEKKGRKRCLLMYKRRELENAGLFLLRCIDETIGLSDCVAEELKVYIPREEPGFLKKIITLAGFACYLGGSLKEYALTGNLLSLSGLRSWPSRKINYFLERISTYKPAVNLEKAQDNARGVSTVKLYFENGSLGYCDGTLSTLWDQPCRMRHFFAPLGAVRRRVLALVKEKIFMLNYTKSFDYMSLLAARFIEGLKTGIRKIEFLDENAYVLERLEYGSLKPSFCIGYYPKIVNKGLVFLEPAKRFKKIAVLGGDAFYAQVSTRFLIPQAHAGLVVNNIFLKRKEKTLPSWGIMSDKKENVSYFLKKYLQCWPYMEDIFLADMKIIEDFFTAEETGKDLEKIIPSALTFEKEEDFAKVIEILALIFKETLGNAALKQARGAIAQGKDSFTIMIPTISHETKRSFNSSCFYLDGKRAFLI
jgi:hypothetical protein